MATQQQEQQTGKLNAPVKKRKRPSQRTLVITTVIIIALAISIIWMLSSLSIIPRSWATISSIIVTVLGVVFAFLQSLHLFFPPDTHRSQVASEHALSPPLPQIPPVIVQPTHRGILGLPPPTDPRTIQQRQHVVKEVYTKLTQPGITAIALTGIGGVGKSTLAALIYNYAEEQRSSQNSPFLIEALWLTVDPAVTFADLAGNLFEALGKPLPDLGNLAPQNQAVALFNTLNTTNKPRLVILDQFENLLDWETGRALTDRPGVGEWLDIINSQQCACRILLTSRPRPVGTRKYPPTYLQEHPVGGLEIGEGVELLRKQGVNGTETELHTAVTRCAGHAFSLTLLASLIRDHSMSLTSLFEDPTLWIGDIATNLLDHIYMQRSSGVQRELLLAFSVYREPVPMDAAQAIISKAPRVQVSPALKALRTQHLLEAVGEGHYQLHAIISDYMQSRFDESDEDANEEALRIAHARAAQYYLQRAVTTCPPREERHGISDVHDLIEAIWQYCQAEKWQEAYDLMEKEAIFGDLHRWGSNATLLELYQLLQTVKWNSNPSETAHICHNLGWTYNDLGQLDQAQKYFEKALMLWRELDDREREGVTLNGLGSVYRDLGQTEQGQKCLEQALNIFRESRNRQEESTSLTSLAIIYSFFGQKERACVYCEQALIICRELGDQGGEGWALNNLGAIYADLGQKERARDYLRQGLQIRRELGNRLGEGRSLNNLGRVYILLEQSEQALKCCEEALSISREIGDYLGEGKACSNLGLIYAALGERELAQDYYGQALHIFRGVGERISEGKALKNLGQVYNELGQMEKAFESYQKALRILREVGDRWGESETVYNVGTLYFKQGHYDVALASFLLAKGIFDELQNPLRTETQKQIDTLYETLGDEQFTALLVQVEPQAQKIVEQALHGEME